MNNHPSLEGFPVITAQEMARLEKLAYAQGKKDETFMKNAGNAVASFVETFVSEHGHKKEILFLAGKGNNGGDGFVAAIKLLKAGYKIGCYQIAPLSECTPLCQKNAKRFQKAGGKIHLFQKDKISLPKKGIILDGLVGTGFKGKAEGILEEAIVFANQTKLPILAIDIPSGLNGTTGEVGSVAIVATQTIYLGLPKLGFFIGKGWDHSGKLVRADFGLSKEIAKQAEPVAYLMNEENLASFLPPIKRTRHKYEAGYVLAIGGSKEMSGAIILSAFASLRAGAGIVRLFYPKGIEQEFFKAPLELLKEEWDLKNSQRILEESKRAKAILLGPGMGRTKEAEQAVKHLIESISLPFVLDADALYFLSKNSQWKMPKISILTPHHQEMKRLLGDKEPNMEICQREAEKRKVTIVLKGAPTIVFHPHTKPLIIPHGDPGMATAGTGDVLTGIIAALLAQGQEPRTAAAFGVMLHGLAGEFAAKNLSSYSIIASDLIDDLSEVFLTIEQIN